MKPVSPNEGPSTEMALKWAIGIVQANHHVFRQSSRSGRLLSGKIKSVGRVYQQTLVDTYSKGAAAQALYDQPPLSAASLLNDQVPPFFAEQAICPDPHPNG
ncbi:hypothetical protein C8R31_101718 [Nitrosospira sp. Nsp2]|nr:hypothetical protein C8R31_101718 [Nitrosospira sp. Nsp2]